MLEEMTTVQTNIYINLHLSANFDLSLISSIMHKGHHGCDHSAENSDLETMYQVDMDVLK